MLKKIFLLLLVTHWSTVNTLTEQQYTIQQDRNTKITLQRDRNTKITLSITGTPPAEDILFIIETAADYIDEQEAASLYVELNRNMMDTLKMEIERSLQEDLANNVSLNDAYFIENFGKFMKSMTDATLEICLDAGTLQHVLPLEVRKAVNNSMIACCQMLMVTLGGKITEKFSTLNLENADDKKTALEFMTRLLGDYLLEIVATQERTLAQFYPDAFPSNLSQSNSPQS